MVGRDTFERSTMRLLPQSVALAATLSLLATGSALAGPHGAAAPPSPHAAAPVPPIMAHAAGATNGTTAITGPTLRGPAQTGQPNKTCGTAGALITPGTAASA